MLEVMWLVLTNESELFQRNITTLLQNLFKIIATSSLTWLFLDDFVGEKSEFYVQLVAFVSAVGNLRLVSLVAVVVVTADEIFDQLLQFRVLVKLLLGQRLSLYRDKSKGSNPA